MSPARLLSLSATALAAALVLIGLAWLFQRRLIYMPLEHRVPPAGQVLAGAVDVAFETEDGLRLGGWLLQPAQPAGSAAVLVFNGNAGHRAYRAPLGAALAARGLSVLLFDYRGYGGNPGRPTEEGLLRDARSARSFLASRPGVDPGRIVYLGESLGAAVAVALAREQPPAALILRSPFTSLVAVGKLHYPFLPVASLLRDRYPSIDRIGEVDSPLLVIAGRRDRIVPWDQSRALFDAARRPGRFVTIEQAGHNDAALLDGRQLIDEVVRFVDAATRTGSGDAQDRR